MNRPLRILLFLLLTVPLAAQGVGANGIKKGSWRTKDVPEGWKIYNVGRYEFQSNTVEAHVNQVAKHLNAMYDLYGKTFPAGRTPTKTFVVKIFKNRVEFLAYGAPPQAAAYYSWRDKEMVGYDTGKIDGVMTKPATTGKKDDNPFAEKLRALEERHSMDMLGVFAHEGWHQYFHWWCTSKIAFPSWCDEGIGEYFYTARVRNGKTETGSPNDYRLGTIKGAIKKGTHIPLKELVTFDQRKYYARAGLCYAEGWSLCHFFLEDPDYKKQRYLSRFVTTFVDQHAIDKAVEQVFGRMDWEKTEADWKKWVLDLKFPGGEKEEADLADVLEEMMKKGGLPTPPEGEGEGDPPDPTPPAPPSPRPPGGG